MLVLMKQVIRSHIKPYKYFSENNECVGTYVMHLPDAFNGFNIEFTPLPGTKIETAVKESIKLSNKYEMSVWMSWFRIKIDIPYKTDNDEKSVTNIVDKYLKTFEQRAATARCVGA